MQRAFPLFLLLCGFSAAAIAQSTAPQDTPPQNDAPRPVLPESLQWNGVPNNQALQGAWMMGSEQAVGPYVLRVRIAANGRIPPHVHPDTRISTVLSGTLYVGFGETFDESKVTAVPIGAVYVASANVPHYIWAKEGDVEYQETGIGPTGTVFESAKAAVDSRHTPEGPLTSLAWLAGCWGSESGAAGTGETWLPPAGGSMLGVERTIENGKRVSYGFMRIEINEDGKLAFIALPSGQQETSFPVLSLTADSVTFENLQHDFPQRVMYRALPDGRLFARIEGINEGVEQGIDYPMKRVSCESLGKSAP